MPSVRHIDPLDQQLDDARLLGREQLVPQRIEADQRLADLRLGDAAVLLRCAARQVATTTSGVRSSAGAGR